MSLQSLFANQKVLIFGLGLQGGGVSDALIAHHFGARVRVTDLKPASALTPSLAQLPPDIDLSLGGHTDDDIHWADLIILNPGVPPDNQYLKLAHQLQKPVYGSAALYLKYTSLITIGITGTRGKSTTTHLVYHFLNRAFPGQVLLGGNIPGHSPLSFINQEKGKKYAVLELSSFQLHFCHSLQVSPHISVVTNIYPDHLNRYSSMQAYIHDKLALVQYQTNQDYAILNRNDTQAHLFAQATPAKISYFDYSNLPTPLVGKHNQANLAAATKVAEILHLDHNLVKQAAANFTGLPFRLERVGEREGVVFINDTTSTTPIATITAINSLPGNIILIVGGESKNLPIQAMVDLICSSPKVKKVVILGSQNNSEFLGKIKTCQDKILGQVFDMLSAVKLSFAAAQKGDIILLSPGFASFDLFKNEFDRGRQFNDCIQKL